MSRLTALPSTGAVPFQPLVQEFRLAGHATAETGEDETFRTLYDDDHLYSYWDYRAGDFHQHRGMRIDLVLATKPLVDTATFALIDRFARKGKGPSDHAPLLVDYEGF